MQKMQSSARLGTEPVGKLLWEMAIPTVLAQMVNLLYNIVDRIYVGHIPETGALALAGLGVTFPITMLVSAFASLVGGGGAARASIALGKGDGELAQKILNNCVTLLLILSAALMAVFLPLRDTILMAFGASENTLPYASGYIFIYLLGTVFVQLTLGLNVFITNQGFSKMSMVTVCIGAALNICLDPILIYGFHMGVQGAALATILSQGVSAVWVVCFLNGKKSGLHVRLRDMGLNWQVLSPVLGLGLSPFVMQSTECLVQLAFNNGMQKYGDDRYVALMSICFSLTQIVWLPVSGFGQGAQPLVGYNYGAGRYDRVRQTFWKMLKTLLIFTLSAIAVVELFPRVFMRMFTSDPELIQMGKPCVRLFLAGLSVIGLQASCQQTLMALGQAKISMFLAMNRKLILLLPLALILPRVGGLGVWGLLLAEPVSDFLASCTTCVIFLWRSKKLLPKQQSV